MRITFTRLASFSAALFLIQNIPAQSLQTFVPVTPCRVVDTRSFAGFTGAFGPPALVGAVAREFNLPAGGCSLPANPAAYSLNITVVPQGPLGYLSIWPTGVAQPSVSTLNSGYGQVVANAAIVPAGTNASVTVYASSATDLIIDVNGYFVNNISSATSNTAFGQGALTLTSGGQNTGIGFAALSANSTGSYNTANGAGALENNAFGSNNTALGQQALTNNTNGNGNTAVGAGSMANVTNTSANTAVGFDALNAAAGSDNVAIGAQAGQYMNGANNIAIGFQAGTNIISGSNDIYIGNQGGANNESNTIRIGGGGVHNALFVAGVSGVNIGTGSAVLINSNGQLGTVQSSRRYKEDIQAMGDTSDKLMQLQPVTFRYRQAAPDGSKTLQYGLIAEQVANVYPELVVFNNDGQPESVQYHELPAMLLNEIQKQNQLIKQLQDRLAALEAKTTAPTTESSQP